MRKQLILVVWPHARISSLLPLLPPALPWLHARASSLPQPQPTLNPVRPAANPPSPSALARAPERRVRPCSSYSILFSLLAPFVGVTYSSSSSPLFLVSPDYLVGLFTVVHPKPHRQFVSFVSPCLSLPPLLLCPDHSHSLNTGPFLPFLPCCFLDHPVQSFRGCVSTIHSYSFFSAIASTERIPTFCSSMIYIAHIA